MEYEQGSRRRAKQSEPLLPVLTPAQQTYQRKVFQGYIQDRDAAPAREQERQRLVSSHQLGAFTRLAEPGQVHVQRQQQRVTPILQAAELRQQDKLALQRTQDELSTVQRSVQASSRNLSAYGLAPAGPLDVIQLQREESRQAVLTPVPPLPLQPVQRQALMRDAEDTIGAALTRDAKYLPAAGRVDVAHAAVQRYAQQGLDREALRGVMVQRAPDESTRESVTRLLTAQRRQETQAQEDKEERGLLLGHHGLQRRMQDAQAEHDAEQSQSLSERIQARVGAGAPLPVDVRRQLELGLNADLSRVRIHDDSEADKLAKSIQAVAFTSGQDIFFRAGKYQPGTQTGFALLLHEGTHTVQQAKSQAKPGIDADPGLEQEAVANEGKVAMLPASAVPETSTSKTAHTGQATTGRVVQRKANPMPTTPADFWFDPTWVHQFAGTLGKSRISMTLTRSGEKVTGTYQYQGHSGQLTLSGNFDAGNGTAQLSELDLTSPAGERGQAKLQLIPSAGGPSLIGNWTGGGKQLEISLKLNEAAKTPDGPKPGPAGHLSPATIEGCIQAVLHSTRTFDAGQAPTEANVRKLVPLIVAEAQREGITDPAQIAVMLANASHESGFDPTMPEGLYYRTANRLLQMYPGHFHTRAEADKYLRKPEALANRVYADQDGNGNEASGDGWRYRGRGLVQITHRGAYQRITVLLKDLVKDANGKSIDFEQNPDAISEVDPAVVTLVRGVAQGIFTQKGKLETFLNEHQGRDAGTFTTARRKFVGNADADIVGRTTVAIYQAIKKLDFSLVPEKRP